MSVYIVLISRLSYDMECLKCQSLHYTIVKLQKSSEIGESFFVPLLFLAPCVCLMQDHNSEEKRVLTENQDNSEYWRQQVWCRLEMDRRAQTEELRSFFGTAIFSF